jgi:hypothetical protein
MIIYLKENMMPYDVPNSITLGFSKSNHQSNVDGLSYGIVNETVSYSIQAKTLYPWTDWIPQDVYMEYVVPYAVLNEPRTDYRPLFFNALKESLKHSGNNNTQSTQDQIKEVVKLINTDLWALMGRDLKPIVFQASQTRKSLIVLLVSSLRSNTHNTLRSSKNLRPPLCYCVRIFKLYRLGNNVGISAAISRYSCTHGWYTSLVWRSKQRRS